MPSKGKSTKKTGRGPNCKNYHCFFVTSCCFPYASAQSIKKHLSLEDEVAASVQAELAEEASNRPATYNNCSVKHNARALHRYFLAKNNWVNLTNKQRYISISFYWFSNMHASVSYCDSFNDSLISLLPGKQQPILRSYFTAHRMICRLPPSSCNVPRVWVNVHAISLLTVTCLCCSFGARKRARWRCPLSLGTRAIWRFRGAISNSRASRNAG
jgi:hypothetical protein